MTAGHSFWQRGEHDRRCRGRGVNGGGCALPAGGHEPRAAPLCARRPARIAPITFPTVAAAVAFAAGVSCGAHNGRIEPDLPDPDPPDPDLTHPDMADLTLLDPDPLISSGRMPWERQARCACTWVAAHVAGHSACPATQATTGCGAWGVRGALDRWDKSAGVSSGTLALLEGALLVRMALPPGVPAAACRWRHVSITYLNSISQQHNLNNISQHALQRLRGGAARG